MIERHAGRPRIGQKVGIVGRTWPGFHFVLDMRFHHLALHDVPRNLHAGNMDPAILFRAQIVGLYCRCLHRISGEDMNASPTFGTKLAGAECDSGKAVELPLFRIGEAGMGDMVLDVGAGETLAASNEPGKHARRHRQHAAPCEEEPGNLNGKADSMRTLVERNVAPQPPGQARDVVVGEILANAFQVMGNSDAMCCKMVRIADPRQLEYLRRLDRARAEDNFPVRGHVDVLAAKTAGQAGHARCCAGFNLQRGDMGAGHNTEVRPPPCGVEIGFLCRKA